MEESSPPPNFWCDMDRESVELDSLNKIELTRIHNAAQELLGRGSAHDIVQEFTTVQSALSAVALRISELRKMYKYVDTLWSPTSGVSLYASDKSRTLDQKHATVTTLDLSLELTVLVSSNPKRLNTRAGVIFDLYKSNDCGPTGEDFVRYMVRQGYKRRLALSTLHWDIKHGFVKLG